MTYKLNQLAKSEEDIILKKTQSRSSWINTEVITRGTLRKRTVRATICVACACGVRKKEDCDLLQHEILLLVRNSTGDNIHFTAFFEVESQNRESKVFKKGEKVWFLQESVPTERWFCQDFSSNPDCGMKNLVVSIAPKTAAADPLVPVQIGGKVIIRIIIDSDYETSKERFESFRKMLLGEDPQTNQAIKADLTLQAEWGTEYGD